MENQNTAKGATVKMSTTDSLINAISNEVERLRQVRMNLYSASEKLEDYPPIPDDDSGKLSEEPRNLRLKLETLLEILKTENGELEDISVHLNEHL